MASNYYPTEQQILTILQLDHHGYVYNFHYFDNHRTMIVYTKPDQPFYYATINPEGLVNTMPVKEYLENL